VNVTCSIARWLLVSSSLLMSGCISGTTQTGRARWLKFEDIEASDMALERPAVRVSLSPPRPRIGESFRVEVEGQQEQSYFVFLMLPNDDLYLLAPSGLVADNSGRRLQIPDPQTTQLLVAPDSPGLAYIGVIAADHNTNLLRAGWLTPSGGRGLAVWPADRPLDLALDFIVEALEDQPWTRTTVAFELGHDPDTSRARAGPR